MGLEKFMHDLTPHRIGHKVRVTENFKYAADWPGEYVVVGLTWEYQKGDGRVNIAIASLDEIEHGLGSTDGFTVNDLAQPEEPYGTPGQNLN